MKPANEIINLKKNLAFVLNIENYNFIMGIDTDRFVSTVNDELICIICSEVLENPMECSTCQTNYCESCIKL